MVIILRRHGRRRPRDRSRRRSVDAGWQENSCRPVMGAHDPRHRLRNSCNRTRISVVHSWWLLGMVLEASCGNRRGDGSHRRD